MVLSLYQLKTAQLSLITVNRYRSWSRSTVVRDLPIMMDRCASSGQLRLSSVWLKPRPQNVDTRVSVHSHEQNIIFPHVSRSSPGRTTPCPHSAPLVNTRSALSYVDDSGNNSSETTQKNDRFQKLKLMRCKLQYLMQVQYYSV